MDTKYAMLIYPTHMAPAKVTQSENYRKLYIAALLCGRQKKKFQSKANVLTVKKKSTLLLWQATGLLATVWQVGGEGGIAGQIATVGEATHLHFPPPMANTSLCPSHMKGWGKKWQTVLMHLCYYK